MSIVVETSPSGDVLQKSISKNKVDRGKATFQSMPNYRSVVQFWPQGGCEFFARKLEEVGSGVRGVGKKPPAPPAEEAEEDDSEEDSDSSVSMYLAAVLSAIDANKTQPLSLPHLLSAPLWLFAHHLETLFRLPTASPTLPMVSTTSSAPTAGTSLTHPSRTRALLQSVGFSTSTAFLLTRKPAAFSLLLFLCPL